MNFEISSRTKRIHSILPVVGHTTTDGTGIGVDTFGWEAATMIYIFGAPGDTLSGSVHMVPTLVESSDNSTFSAVAAGDLGPSTLIDVNTNGKASQGYSVAYLGSKRYIAALITFTGTFTNGTPICAEAVLAHGKHVGGDAV